MFSEHTPFAKWFITVSSIERSYGNCDLPEINIFQWPWDFTTLKVCGKINWLIPYDWRELVVLRNRSQEACLSLHWLNCWATRRVLLKGGMPETNWKLSRLKAGSWERRMGWGRSNWLSLREQELFKPWPCGVRILHVTQTIVFKRLNKHQKDSCWRHIFLYKIVDFSLMALLYIPDSLFLPVSRTCLKNTNSAIDTVEALEVELEETSISVLWVNWGRERT